MEIKDRNFDEERALYGLRDVSVTHCNFEGPADGESALKECDNITVSDCRFLLRYPLWHVRTADLRRVTMTSTCRAALWYDSDLTIRESILGGIKALRECDRVTLSDCEIESQEFGWFCRGVDVKDTSLLSEYPFLHSKDLTFDRFSLEGKYSFQYVENMTVRNSRLKTKDAFWHSKNVTVYDTVIEGEYLGWYSENLTLIRCKIIGTQPLCYAKNLVMKDCTMTACDFSFENSTVDADIIGHIDSVKSPAGGRVVADSIGEILHDKAVAPENACEIVCRKN